MHNQDNLHQMLTKPELTAEEKISILNASENMLDELNKYIHSNMNLISIIRSKKLKVCFVKLDKDSFSSYKIERSACKDMIEDISKVVHITEKSENEFEIEFKDIIQALLVKLAFSGIELEELKLRIVVTGISSLKPHGIRIF